MWVSGGELGPGKVGGGGARSNTPLGQASSASVELSQLESRGDLYYWLQMTFASIYVLHFDFAFNFRSIHGVCTAWGMRN